MDAKIDADEVNGRYSDADHERLRIEIEQLRAQLVEIQETLDCIARALEGNGNPGLSRVLEEIHRTVQLQNEVIAALMNKLNLDRILSEALANLQACKVVQFAASE